MITFDEFDTQWKADILEGEPSTTERGHRFTQKLLRDWQEIDPDSAEILLCDGAGDGGIDAAVFVAKDSEEGLEGDTWYLIQSKFGTAFAGSSTVMEEAQKVFATLEGKRERLSGLSSELVARLRTFIANCGSRDRLEYVLATTRRPNSEELAYLDDVRVLGRSKFGECFDVEAVSVETLYNKVVEEQAAQESSKISVQLRTAVAHSGAGLLVGATQLSAMFDFMRSYKESTGDLDFLYEKNVRKFLGNKRKVNKGIEATIEDHPERFGLYNNGITIVAESFEEQRDGTVSLANPFIVNGCQTTRSIWSVLQRKLNAGGSAPTLAHQQWRARLDQGVVVTKIVAVGAEGEELLTQTTRFTNSQNAVSEKDFVALERDFRNWAPIFNERYGVFLEIQRGAWEARRAFQKQNPLATPRFEEAAFAFDLLKVYAAGWLKEPGFAYAKNPPFAPGGSIFNRITQDAEFGVESLFAAHLLQRLADSHRFGRGAERATRGQTRFLFHYVVIELLRDVLVNLPLPHTNADVSRAVVRLAENDLLRLLGDSAITVVDDYLTQGNEDTLFLEPEYQRQGDLNAFLKSERLGKSAEYAPHFTGLLAVEKRGFRRQAPMSDLRKALSTQ